jgi:uncharacterized protein with gpF-like domain
MKEAKSLADKEIDALKRTIAEQADRLRSQDVKAEEHKKLQEEMREEIVQAINELDAVHAELKSKSPYFPLLSGLHYCKSILHLGLIFIV